jgi:two-component system, response regulator
MEKQFLYNQLSIFIADDDEDDVFLVKRAFNEVAADINLKHFSDGIQLLQELKNYSHHLPCLVLLDLNMPVLDGRQTLLKIRQDQNFDNLPVIIFSTSNHQLEKNQCYENGANFYFTKPNKFSNYIEIIKTLKTEWIDNVVA